MLMKLFISLFSSVFLFMPSFSTKLLTNTETDSLIDSSNRSDDDANLGNVLPSENDDAFVSIPIKTDQKQIDQFLEEIYDECGEKKEKNLEIINKILKIRRKNDKKSLKTEEDEQKIKIVHQFIEMQNEFDENGKRKYENVNEIAKIIGVTHSRIYHWIDKYGLSHLKKDIQNDRRIAIVHQFFAMQKELDENGQPKYQNVNEISKKLGVYSATIIYRWMHKFGLSHLINETGVFNKSDIWSFFEQMPISQSAKCKKCGEEIPKMAGRMILNMRRHLQKEHQLLI